MVQAARIGFLIVGDQSMKQYRFDDVQGLQEIVSEQWGEWSNEFTVSQDVIQRFADLTTTGFTWM